MADTRDRIIEATAALLEAQGFHGTGLNQIVRESGAPKGSLYYYFPGGKEELAAEAIAWSARVTAERMRDVMAPYATAVDAVRALLLSVAQSMRESSYRTGSPVATVALEMAAVSDGVSDACRAAYDLWQDVLRDRLVEVGQERGRATRLAILIMASIEGAVVLSHAARGVAPLEHVAASLPLLLSPDERARAKPIVAPEDQDILAPPIVATPGRVVAREKQHGPEPPLATTPRPIIAKEEEAKPAPAIRATPNRAEVEVGRERAPRESAPESPKTETTESIAAASAPAPIDPEPVVRRTRRPSPMRLAIFGATGKTGSLLVEQALAAGHSVVAFVRDPTKIWAKHQRLTVVQGDVRDREAVSHAIEGADAALCALGPASGAGRYVLSLGVRNIVEAMTMRGVPRLICLTQADVGPSEGGEPARGSLMRSLRRAVAGRTLRDAARMVQIIRSSSLEWVIVRAPRLSDGDHTGHYRAGDVEMASRSQISRADAADFMLRLLTDDTYLHDMPLVAY